MRFKRGSEKMASKKKVSFIYPHSSSFIESDLEILKQEFDVRPILYQGKKDLVKLKMNIMKSPVNITWFALGNATMAVLLSKILMKNSIVIVGGWDVVYMPEIDYGAMKSKNRIRKTSYALKKASKIICVSESIAEYTKEWTDRDDIIVLPLGFDPEKFKPQGEKENMVLTAGNLKNEVTIKVKGLATFFKCAELLPEFKFVLIGKHDPEILKDWKARAPDNLDILDFIPQEELLKYYQKAKVYAQLSFQESFGSALAEAMLCECVPVVTRRGALPEVVGDCGFYAEYADENETANMIREAIISDKGKDARIRIKTHYPLSKRKEQLIKIVNDTLHN
jgi:glycosyltransferase involved in cell wall biosynthesis